MNPIICTWSAKIPKGGVAIWPDGCRDLIAVIPRAQPTKVLCSGLDFTVRRVVCADETRFIGVRLAPGVTFQWDRVALGKIHMDHDLSHHGRHWGNMTDHDEILNELFRLIASSASPAPDWVEDYLGELWNGKAGSVRSLSERTIRRQLVQVTGAPPRYWQGLARARKAGREVSRSAASLASIAADYGFSDQAHMSREIRRWFGCTSMTLRANKEQAIARLTAPDAFHGI